MSLSQPVIVLVHGAWADASNWSSVTSELQRRDFTVYAPPNHCAACRRTRPICTSS